MSAAVWDAQAEHDIGVLIRRYLHEHPAPPGSLAAPELEAAARDLEAAGKQQLDRLAATRLRAVR